MLYVTNKFENTMGLNTKAISAEDAEKVMHANRYNITYADSIVDTEIHDRDVVMFFAGAEYCVSAKEGTWIGACGLIQHGPYCDRGDDCWEADGHGVCQHFGIFDNFGGR